MTSDERDAHDHGESDHLGPGDESVDDARGRLDEAGEPYVVATVVRREAPISATVGDRAVVTDDGVVAGWIGGVGCAETAVVRESRLVLAAGEPALVGLAPDPESVDRPGLKAFPLTCASGGSIEVFLEPVNTVPGLLVVGGSAVARAVAESAADLGFRVVVVDPGGGPHPAADAVVTTTDYHEIAEAADGAAAVVVASVGEFDARGVAAALELDADYVGLVASRRRAEEVVERTAELVGVDPETVAERVRSPAGLDIGAETPAEIAVSVGAELVRERPSLGGGAARAEADAADPEREEAVDPVCGMTVATGDAAATVDHEGETYYFCSQGCADAFAAAPEEHLGQA